MIRVFAASPDSEWIRRLREVTRERGIALDSRATLAFTPRPPEYDLILIDADLLPGPTDQALTAIHQKLRGLPVIAVHSPGTRLAMNDVRKSFIAGARSLMEKPRSQAEFDNVLHAVSSPRTPLVA